MTATKTAKAATPRTKRATATKTTPRKATATPRKRPTKATVTPLRTTKKATPLRVYATYDRTKDGDYRVTLRTSDDLNGTSEVVRVDSVDAAKALVATRKAVYVKNFRAAAALEEQRLAESA